MGFWKKLFGLEGKKKAKFNVFAIDGDGDGKVQDGTIWERPVELSVNLDETLAKAEKLLEEIAPAVKPVKKTTKKASTTKKAPAKKASTTKKPTTKSAPKKADPKKAKSKATSTKKK
jgi:topoisomerase IA-like protein